MHLSLISLALARIYGGATSFTPASLFASGEQGVWYDPSDMSTMFQDSAGTIPVTAAGQPVGKILDKSGRGNHASQATAAKRPLLQTSGGLWYLQFDGVDDALSTGNINLTTTNKLGCFFGARKLSDASAGMLVELTIESNVYNGFYISAPEGVGDYGVRVSSGAGYNHATFNAPITNVFSGNWDRSAASLSLGVVDRFNGVLNTTNPTGTLTNTAYPNLPLFIGSRAGSSFPFNGNLYQLVVLGRTPTALETTNTEAYIAAKSGVTLP